MFHHVDARLEAGRVHGHKDVRAVAVGRDVVIRDMDLKRRNSAQRSRWRTNLSRVVRERCEVVAEQSTGCGESITSQLHAVARVAGEPDNNPVELLRDRGVAFHD